MGSNGLTSARHDVFAKYIAEKFPETYNTDLPDNVVYCGSKKLTDEIDTPSGKITAGKLVLSPTRTYAPVVKKIIERFHGKINGMIHCSGGGQTKVLHFTDQHHIIKDNLFEVPPLFRLIQEESKTDWKEMYTVFNMGHRLEIYISPDIADDIIEISNEFGIEAKVIGRVEESNSKKLTIRSEYGEYHY
jgi:phosphoribosylformylglycinamidine cyclo-ligase